MNNYKVVAMRLNDKKVLYEKGNKDKNDYGLGNALFLNYVLDLLKYKKIKLQASVKISEFISKTSRKDKVFLEEGKEITIYKLLQLVINLNCNAAVLAIAEHLDPTRNNPAIKVKVKRDEYDLEKQVAINISGRKMKNKPQSYTIEDLLKIGEKMFGQYEKDFKLYNSSLVDYRGTVYENPSFIDTDDRVVCNYLFGSHDNSGIVLTNINNERVLLAIMGADNAFHRDFLLKEAMDEIQFDIKAPKLEVETFTGEKEINFLGDTYFGEFYTERRKKRNQEDALMRYGYDHSLKHLKTFFDPNGYNIINFEAVFTEEGEVSNLEGAKPFLLWANEEKTLNALRSLNLNAVSLGNNHAMDFGLNRLKQTIEGFKNNDLKVFGAGLNSKEALAPIHLNINNRNVYIYNGYWYRKIAYRKFDFYAIGHDAGVAPLYLINEEIRRKKQEDPNCFIIVQPHWGVDFKQILPYQVENAEQLIHSGCDLILGHGPHTIQKLRRYNNTVIVYSMGNGIFNSNGEFDKHDALPYGFLTKLKFLENDEIKLRLVPFYANNLDTFWCPDYVNDEQFKEIVEFIAEGKEYIETDWENRAFEIKIK